MKPDIHTLTGAYVVDGLSGDERAAFERHMTECAACAQEIAELQETVARLGVATETAPPPSVRSRVLAEVSQVRQLPPVRDVQPPLVAPTGGPQRWLLWVSGTAAAASIVLAVVFGVSADRTNERLADELDRLRVTDSALDSMTGMLAAPDAALVSGRTDDGAAGTVVLSRSLGQLMFVPDQLPALPAGRAYQLWLIGNDGPRSAGVLDSADQPVFAADLAGPLAAAAQVAVTVEPAGGSARPSTSPVMLMTLPA